MYPFKNELRPRPSGFGRLRNGNLMCFCFPIKCFSISLENYCFHVRGSNTEICPSLPWSTAWGISISPALSMIWAKTPRHCLQAAGARPPIPSCCHCCRVGHLPQKHSIFPIYSISKQGMPAEKMEIGNTDGSCCICLRAQQCATATSHLLGQEG